VPCQEQPRLAQFDPSMRDARTLVIHHDEVYGQSLLNDRLLLGLKGTMNEFEIRLLRQCAMEAHRQKVPRGLGPTQASVGYVRTEDKGKEKTPFRHPPSARPKLRWAGGSHTELTVHKNRTGYRNHINSHEVTGLIRERALVCADTSIVSIPSRLGYRTRGSNTWTEKCVQHVLHTNGLPACPPPDQRPWITVQQTAVVLGVGEWWSAGLLRRTAKQVVKFAPG
jgi:hypothetical protein